MLRLVRRIQYEDMLMIVDDRELRGMIQEDALWGKAGELYNELAGAKEEIEVVIISRAEYEKLKESAKQNTSST